uniref:uncharacterized protein n=1 Tax=Myxine glutinosa TaxID=7769 RepID=UPI00358F3AF3
MCSLHFADSSAAGNITHQRPLATIPDRPESRRHPQLRSDIKKVKEEYGNGVVAIRECEDIDKVFINLRLEIWVMQKVSMMEESLPLFIRLGFSLSKYIDGDEPSVELIVPNNKGYFKNLLLMESMLKTFLASRWKRSNVPPNPNPDPNPNNPNPHPNPNPNNPNPNNPNPNPNPNNPNPDPNPNNPNPNPNPPKNVKRRRIVSRFLKRAHSLFKPTYRRNRKKDYALLPLSEQGILLEVSFHHWFMKV